MIFKYTFADGTILRLFIVGLSADEVFKLEELHGKCQGVTTESIKEMNESAEMQELCEEGADE